VGIVFVCVCICIESGVRMVRSVLGMGGGLGSGEWFNMSSINKRRVLSIKRRGIVCWSV